jgi:hypothetical protein
MITVIFAGAALTVMATTAGIMAVRGLRSSTDSKIGSQAVAYAEAGLERFLNELKRGGFGIAAIMEAGCATPPVSLPAGVVGNGTYVAELTVYDPNQPPAQQVPASPWTAANDLAAPCIGRSTSARTPQAYAISSTGTANQGRRVIRGVVTITGAGLPGGVFVNKVDANGNPDFKNISLFVKGDVSGREKLSFTGNDLVYFLGDVYPGRSMTTPVPAAVHATGVIYLKGEAKGQEHPPNPNCAANPRGTAGQSLWDGSAGGNDVTSGCAGQVGFPPTSKFTQTDYNRIGGATNLPQLDEATYLTLKSSAQASGIYCYIPTTGAASCTKAGAAINPVPATWVNGSLTGLAANFVAYFEYAPSSNPLAREIKWDANVGPCESGSSAIVVVRNGGLTMRGGNALNGNVVAPEGIVDVAGGYTVTGGIIAKEIRLRGTSTMQMTPCWTQNSPAAAISVTGGRWSELDR